ncbi:hypothetical protein [Sphingobium yanoikuyae]|jgi:hypothetical protein|uniref:Uncharacterized protein n=1 Tax=Sphingobium yanoikuyae TaxID=13690 RepID=A0A9X7YGJ7_SPHYA|nr:hypothetical protein [Sphingobium yanoikuyae]QNG49809.1 hypothetical protein H3V42_33880 [Sphingobium yanoikuyae]WQE10092.1 hypothetical protein U0025_26035 [Sphingobium yanoikuyae]
MDHFRDEYRAWLNAALAEDLPSDVEAFAFNLFEKTSDNSRYGIELIGASEFDPSDPDWPCSEIWEPSKGRASEIPLSFCNGSWEECLSQMTDLISAFLHEPSPLSQKLNSVRGIGIGFVDGDLRLLKS